MKILKPGKVEMKKFVCPNCGCVFLASKTEMDADIELYVCPQDGCHYYVIGWEDGDPYEDPTPTQKDRERLGYLIADAFTDLVGYDDRELAFNLAEALIDNGVTFKEV